MLNSKFDLYEIGWLDLVFSDRNQKYGAYDLRQHYGNTMVKAMGITFLSVSVLFASFGFIPKKKVEKPDGGVICIITPPPIAPPVEPKKVKGSQKAEAGPVTPPAPSTRLVPLVVKPDEPEIDPPIIDKIEGPVGPVENKISPTGEVAQNGTPGTPSGPGIVGTVDTPVEGNFESLEVMPEPFGGAAGWAKFLQKNLRFPAAASEHGISAKVFVSFIVERDGHLSDITVIRKMGYGFDEEALRVLKLAPAWRPGKQNGQLVRVRYTLPLSFVIAEE